MTIMNPKPADSAEALQARDLLAMLIQQNRLTEAAGLFETIQAAFPSDTALMAMQAQVCLRLGRNDQAAGLATQALSLGSDDPTTTLVLGFAQRSLGDHAAAAKALAEVHRQLPDLADIACAAIEETVAAHGLDAARPIFGAAFARSQDRSLAVCWARLSFAAGEAAVTPGGFVAGAVTSVPAWLAKAGRTPDVVGEQETTPFQIPPIFGEPSEPHPLLNVPGYRVYAHSLQGATIFSRSNLVLMPDGAILNDTLADERFGRFMTLPHDKTDVGRDGGRLLLDVGQHPLAETEAGIMLSGWGSEHFGHWVPEFLCRLSYLERHPRFKDLPILVDAGMPAQHLEFVRLLVPNPIVEIPLGAAVRCGELIVASPTTFFPMHLAPDHQAPPENQGGFSTESFRYMQARIAERLPPPAARDRKLYLSRKSRAWRRLINEDEVCAALAARGFEILLPEEMTVEEQIRMYQGAKIVIAPNGSSVLNAVFAPKDLKLILLSQRGFFNWGTYYGLMQELGYDVTFFCGDEETDQKHADYSIPLPRLLDAIEPVSSAA
jgi:capsular polysaccharide biosynthesis protein